MEKRMYQGRLRVFNNINQFQLRARGRGLKYPNILPLSLVDVPLMKDEAHYVFPGGKLYSGTVADFSGSDALIIRDRVRTEQYDLKHLNGESDKNGL